MRKKKKSSSGLFALSIAFIFLINPNVNVFDILPDFVAYFIIAKKLNYAVDRSPFFSEARDGFKKLALVSLIKIPAFILMTSFRSQNVGDNDIRALFSVTFAVIEAVLLFSAVKNLFTAFSYLGQRSNNGALISPFFLNKKKTRKMTPDALMIFTYAFVFYKCFMSFLPETFLLTRIVSAGAAERVFNIARLYPYTVVFGIVTVLTIGIIWQSRFKKYIRAFGGEVGFGEALDSMLDDGKRAALEAKHRVDAMSYALSLLAVCSVLTIEIRFDNIKGVNLIPPFIFAFVIMFAGIRLSRCTDKSVGTVIFGSLFTVAAFLRFLLEFSFLERFGYELLVLDPLAKKSYLVLMCALLLEVMLFVCLMLSVCRLLKSFVKKHTAIEEENERYSRQDKEYHAILTKKVYIFTAMSVVVWAAKLIDCVLRFFSKNTYVSWEVDDENLSIIRPDSGIVNESLLPWFGAIMLLLSVIYIVYSFTFLSQLKEDARMKYIDN